VPLTARFGDAVGDIGRGADCTLVLPDPDREISRRQVLITCRGDRHFICPIGSNLTVELNGSPLAPDVESLLDVGARIGIGPYLLQVERVSEPVGSEEQPAGLQGEEAVGQGEEDPLALFGQAKAAGASVFGDLLDTPTSRGVRTAKTASVPSEGAGKPPGKAVAEVAAPTQRSVPVAAPVPSPAAPKSARRARATTATKRGSAGAEQNRQAAADEVVAALFGGLGVAVPADNERVKQAQLVGRMLRATISGTLELLAARTIAKREMGENATLLKVRENNPLKFSPDTDAALARLLAPVEHGFTEPLAAVQDAFGDLRAHQLAMLSGMRAALDEVLARFDPTALEPRLSPGGALWDKLVPASRKAKLWEQYCEQYAQLLHEVEGDFDTLFSRAFLRAYRAQLTELSRSVASARGDEA
jgi:type VI secretion system FHA domain protein